MPILLEIKLLYEFVCPSVGRSVCHAFLKGREYSLPCSYRSTIFHPEQLNKFLMICSSRALGCAPIVIIIPSTERNFINVLNSFYGENLHSYSLSLSQTCNQSINVRRSRGPYYFFFRHRVLGVVASVENHRCIDRDFTFFFIRLFQSKFLYKQPLIASILSKLSIYLQASALFALVLSTKFFRLDPGSMGLWGLRSYSTAETGTFFICKSKRRQ